MLDNTLLDQLPEKFPSRGVFPSTRYASLQ
jgi:hypothetical protein